MHITCVICSDLINLSENIYFTKCGHVFHLQCLSQWIERSKTCPQCRNKVTEKCLFRVFFNFANSEHIAEDATTLQSKLDNLMYQLKEKDILVKKKEKDLEEIKLALNNLQDTHQVLENKYMKKQSAYEAVKQNLDYMKIESTELHATKKERDNAVSALNLFQGLQKVLSDTKEEVEEMINAGTDLQTSCTFVVALKKALVTSELKRNEQRQQILKFKRDLQKNKSETAAMQEKIRVQAERIIVILRKLRSEKIKQKSKKEPNENTFNEASNTTMCEDANKTFEIDNSLILESKDSGGKDCLSSTMVQQIEDSDSPYLKLKSSGFVGAFSNRLGPQATELKPTEFMLFNKQTNTNRRDPFHKKSPLPISKSIFKSSFLDDSNPRVSNRDLSYDGLGGHSKPDFFPKVSNIPKVTAKHRLKRPANLISSPSNDTLEKFLKRLK